ncbi:MAG: AMP-binding protein, partial [Proteobacteria bacterium]|nr:AMP-binding protein [Pseudomonadota bacterium]
MAQPVRSYRHGTSTIPLLDLTIGEALDRAAALWPEQEAVVVRDQGIRLTYTQLRDEADRLAAGLIALGLEPGDRIGLWSPNRAEWVLSQFAAARAGLILVNLNPGYRSAELEYALNKVECKALISADRFKSTDYIAIMREVAPELDHCSPGALHAVRVPHLRTLIHFADSDEPGYYRFRDVPALATTEHHARLQALSGVLQPDDPINIQFTSGTTGAPKAATLTHHGLINNAHIIGLGDGYRQGDRLGNPFPLYHVGGMVVGSIMGIVLGVTAVYLGEAFDPLAALETIQAERCTQFCGVPAMFIAMLNHPDFGRYDLSTLRGG